jgi:hypothetical protein
MRTSMQAAGGDVVYAQAYNPSTGPSDAELQTFVDAVRAQRTTHGSETGVAYFALSEMVPGFAKLNAQPDDFRTVGAVASQSLANVPSMVSNEEARNYLVASNFQAVAFALGADAAIDTPAGAALLGRIAARSGKATPDELSINVYDGMRMLLRAAQRQTGSAVDALKAEAAMSPAGTVGPMHFDANGDRVGDYHAVYKIDVSGTPMWKRIQTIVSPVAKPTRP